MANASVVLMPENGLRFRIDHRVVASNESGRFQFPNVTPGSYKVFAWRSVERGRWQDPDFMRDYEELGKSIRIEENSKATLDLTVILPRN